MSPVQPLDIVHVDLAQGLEALRPSASGRDIFAVFWWRDVPLGHLHLSRRQLAAGGAALVQLIANRITPAVGDRLLPGFAGEAPGRENDQPPPDLAHLAGVSAPFRELEERVADALANRDAPSVSVVVCTRDRPAVLRECLHSLADCSASADEVVIVDNSTAGSMRDVVEEFPRMTYVRENRPGLSRARNTGIRATSGEIVAFTDDDTTLHGDWLARLRDGFAEPDVMVVTGLVLPAALETESQVVFELVYGGFFRGYQRIVYDKAFFEQTRAHATPVWKIGAGANMAVRRRAFELVGGFDERLGAGAAGCSEDSELWYRVLAEGWRCVYEPGAVVFHRHRADDEELRRQMHEYLRGHVAALFVQYARYGHRGNLVRAFLALPRDFAARAIREYVIRSRPSSGTFAAGLTGYLRGLRLLPLARRSRPRRLRE
ncbi:MAG: glycosyltransferase [Actinobacteria bacterium]|nr:glycosyltransferase [Actinomycetota bacterium]